MIDAVNWNRYSDQAKKDILRELLRLAGDCASTFLISPDIIKAVRNLRQFFLDTVSKRTEKLLVWKRIALSMMCSSDDEPEFLRNVLDLKIKPTVLAECQVARENFDLTGDVDFLKPDLFKRNKKFLFRLTLFC